VHQDISIQAVRGPEGVELADLDGLPLVKISHRPDVERVVIERGSRADSLRLLQGSGTVVEEYLVEDLRHITPLMAGEVEVSE
jgi:hypothetical protein